MGSLPAAVGGLISDEMFAMEALTIGIDLKRPLRSRLRDGKNVFQPLHKNFEALDETMVRESLMELAHTLRFDGL